MSTSRSTYPQDSVSGENKSNDDQNNSELPSKQETAEESQQTEQPQLALPAAGSNNETQQLEVNSNGDVKHTLRFDSLGPLVVNKNGTLSRIENWTQMTGAERERTIRVLGKRNMLRMEAVSADEEASNV